MLRTFLPFFSLWKNCADVFVCHSLRSEHTDYHAVEGHSFRCLVLVHKSLRDSSTPFEEYSEKKLKCRFHGFLLLRYIITVSCKVLVYWNIWRCTCPSHNAEFWRSESACKRLRNDDNRRQM
ncbi:hypothetical protein RvY_03853 [Ramazzottius varieornatus]|uniref:Uncharacterized protein n=1 Tax=Ramazzottius varieornatus TaxID=947166 RepID=A0A1D1UV62_RAMVA|nr:hypothetical protein RvY_03853 [Ramazzottius varieornatus]